MHLFVRLMPPGSRSWSSISTPLACPDLLRGVVTPVPTTLGVCRPAAAQHRQAVSPAGRLLVCGRLRCHGRSPCLCQKLYDRILN